MVQYIKCYKCNHNGLTANACSCANQPVNTNLTVNEIDILLKLVRAVNSTNYEGIQCNDVDGKNWFDLRNEILSILKLKWGIGGIFYGI